MPSSFTINYFQEEKGTLFFNKTRIKKPGSKPGFQYMDGLVSTENKFSYTILNIISSMKKIFQHFFLNIFHNRWIPVSFIMNE